MSATNGNGNGKVATLPELREQIRTERALARLAAARQQRQLWEAAGDYAYGDLLNPFGFRQDVFGGIWLPLGGGGPSARKDGRDAPFFQTDADLDRMRGLARWLCHKNDLAIGALETLTDYVVKKGYDWDTRPAEGFERDGRAVELAARVKRVIDDHAELNGLPDRERSAFRRAVRDGEAIVRHFRQGDGSTLVRFVEAEQLRDPGHVGPHCSFGVETEPHDVESPLAYWVTYDGTEYERVPAREVSHYKRNADECVKRGLSDFYSAGDAFDDVAKLLRNMRKGGGVLAAIAYIEKYESATRDQLSAAHGGQIDLNRPQVEHPLSGRRIDYQQMDPGTIVRMNRGKEYLPPPLAGNTTNFTAIVQACLRALGVRWGFPEFLVSGDASNANYSSTMIAGSQFVNRVECTQAPAGRFFLRWRWVAVKNACDAGLIDAPFEEVQRLVDIHFTPPLVAVSTEGEQAEIDSKDIASGVLSLQTRRARRKLDNEQERKNLAEEPPTRVQGRVTDVDAAGNPVAPAGRGPGQPPRPPSRESRLDRLERLVTRLAETFDPNQERDYHGRFGSGGAPEGGAGGGGAAKAATPAHHPGAAHGSKVKVSVVAEMAAPRNARGQIDPVPVETTLSKQETGRVGEAVISAYLRDVAGVGDTVALNAGKTNESIDLFGDSMAPEVKSGMCNVSRGAQQWRVTFSMELGKAERAEYDAMTAEQQKAWRASKQQACLDRKVALLAKLSEQLGRPIRAVTITAIVNPDTRTADIYQTEGYHARVGWNDARAKHVASVRYDHAD